jgi:L-iditol 2-dehydrogenase
VDSVDAILKLTGAAQQDAVQMTARSGRIGLPKTAPTITLDADLVHHRELTIVGVNGASPAHSRPALDLIASGRVPVLDLITHRLPVDQVPDAIQIVAAGNGIKVTIEP